jgi:hypothetical protein
MTMKSTGDILEVNSFLSYEEVDMCLSHFNAVEDNEWWESSGDAFWNKRSYDISSFMNNFNDRADFFSYMSILARIKKHIVERYNVEYPIYPDSFKLVRWEDGEDHDPHSDNADVEGTENPTAPWRIYSAIIYLNDNYSGGQTYFTKFDYDVEPQAGKLLVFPSGLDYEHGVRKIEGDRRTLMSFWSDQNINKRLRLK